MTIEIHGRAHGEVSEDWWYTHCFQPVFDAGIAEGYPVCCVTEFADECARDRNYFPMKKKLGAKSNSHESVFWSFTTPYVPCDECLRMGRAALREELAPDLFTAWIYQGVGLDQIDDVFPMHLHWHPVFSDGSAATVVITDFTLTHFAVEQGDPTTTAARWQQVVWSAYRSGGMPALGLSAKFRKESQHRCRQGWCVRAIEQSEDDARHLIGASREVILGDETAKDLSSPVPKG